MFALEPEVESPAVEVGEGAAVPKKRGLSSPLPVRDEGLSLLLSGLCMNAEGEKGLL